MPETSRTNPELQPAQQSNFEATLNKLKQETNSTDPLAAVHATVDLLNMQEDLKQLHEPDGLQMFFGELSSLTQKAMLDTAQRNENVKERLTNFDLRTTTVVDFLRLLHDMSSNTQPMGIFDPMAILRPMFVWENQLGQFLDTSAMQQKVHSDTVQELIRRERAVDTDREKRLMELKAKGLW